MNKRLSDLKKAEKHVSALVKLNKKYPDVVPFIPLFASVDLGMAIQEAKDESES